MHFIDFFNEMMNHIREYRKTKPRLTQGGLGIEIGKGKYYINKLEKQAWNMKMSDFHELYIYFKGDPKKLLEPFAEAVKRKKEKLERKNKK